MILLSIIFCVNIILLSIIFCVNMILLSIIFCANMILLNIIFRVNMIFYRRHSCKICNKKFKYKHSLVPHMRIHNSIYPFKCNKCYKEFKIKHNYQTHLITHDESKYINLSIGNVCYKHQTVCITNYFVCIN